MTTVVGGVYGERCVEPFWDDVYGSGGRAAAAMSREGPDIQLVTYRSIELLDGMDNLRSLYGLKINGPEVSQSVRFDYLHSLAVPTIRPRRIQLHDTVEVEDDVVLRFGMLDGDARVRAKRAVYDPQSAFRPQWFTANGSHADELAVILNGYEAEKLTGEREPSRAAAALMQSEQAAVVIVKMGSRGSLVLTSAGESYVPAYKSKNVFKIGSGDVYSGAFTLFWGVQGRSAQEAADLASRATSVYCASRRLPIDDATELSSMACIPVTGSAGRVYLAAPFFSIGELWLVHEARALLLDMGVEVFSPLHDVGRGAAREVAPADLAGLDTCGSVLAILKGGDVGTAFEVGYAVAKGKPVVALAQGMRDEDLKMVQGSGCLVLDDLVSAIYHSVWSL